MNILSKKGIELAISTFVVMIIGIIIVVAGIVVMRNLAKGSEDIVKTIDQITKNKIERMLSEGAQLAVPSTSSSIKGGEKYVFFFGLQNKLGTEKNFEIKIISPERGYDLRTGQSISIPEELSFNILLPKSDFKLKPNEAETELSVMIKVPKGMPKAGYPFRLEVYYKENNQDKFYDAQVLTINVN